MNIVKVLKTFDIFNSETIRFFKEKAINIFLIETPTNKQQGVDLISDEKSINVNVINKPKTYKLLISAQKHIEEKRLKEKQAVKL